LTVRYFSIACVLPIFVGGVIYLMFRSQDMLMFQWADMLGLTNALNSARVDLAPIGSHLPDFVLYCVPDGAWVFACTAFFARLWPDGPIWMRVGWIGIGSVLAIGGELGQAIGFVPGTFDPLDILAYTVAAITGVLVSKA